MQSLLLQEYSCGDMSSPACFKHQHFAPQKIYCKYKYVQVYNQEFDAFFFFFPSSFQSPEQGVLRVQLSCPGTDSNLWRCTALGSSDPELLWQSQSSLLRLSTRKQKVLQFSTVINTSLPMENCVSNFFYTQPNLDKWKGQQCRH